MKSAVTVSLVPEARGGPFVFWDGVEAACDVASGLGFDAIEIFPRDPSGLLDGGVERVVLARGLRVAAVGSGAGWVVHKLRFTDPDAGVRARAVDFGVLVAEAARRLEAPMIVGSMQGRWGEGGVSREQALGWLGESLRQILDRVPGSQVLVEPLNRYETNLLNTLEQAAGVVSGVGSDRVRILADLFHMNIEEADMVEGIRRWGGLIGHVHFVDTNRRAVGFGHLDVEPVLAALRGAGYGGYLSAEALPLPDPVGAAVRTMESFRRWVREG